MNIQFIYVNFTVLHQRFREENNLNSRTTYQLFLQLLTTSHGHVSPLQQSLDEAFLKDTVMDRLKDDVPEVVAAALKVLEVSDVVNRCDGSKQAFPRTTSCS